MDSSGKLYVAAMPDAFHLNYYVFENNRFTKTSLVSNTSSNYNLSTPMIYALNNIPYIIYLSHQTSSNAYNFVCENLMQPSLTTLLTLYQAPEQIKYFQTSSEIYIFYITFDETYRLNALCITPQATRVITFLNSPQPISDYSICIEGSRIHITYVAEFHGKFQLFYFNTENNKLTALATTQHSSRPVVFCYYHALWINAMIDHKLHMLISIDQGENFSIPVPSSLQNNIHQCHFQSHKNSSLIAQELYASIGPSIKLCTIAMADIDHFHSDTSVSPEIALLLEGLVLASSHPTYVSQPQQSYAQALPKTNSPKMPSLKTNSAPPKQEPPSQNTVESAKSAFMVQELNSWDLPPRI